MSRSVGTLDLRRRRFQAFLAEGALCGTKSAAGSKLQAAELSVGDSRVQQNMRDFQQGCASRKCTESLHCSPYL